MHYYSSDRRETLILPMAAAHCTLKAAMKDNHECGIAHQSQTVWN